MYIILVYITIIFIIHYREAVFLLILHVCLL